MGNGASTLYPAVILFSTPCGRTIATSGRRWLETGQITRLHSPRRIWPRRIPACLIPRRLSLPAPTIAAAECATRIFTPRALLREFLWLLLETRRPWALLLTPQRCCCACLLLRYRTPQRWKKVSALRLRTSRCWPMERLIRADQLHCNSLARSLRLRMSRFPQARAFRVLSSCNPRIRQPQLL